MESSIESMGSRSHRTLEAVARLGGDEFVALLPEVADERDAERVALRILDLMREPIFVGGQECFVTARQTKRVRARRSRERIRDLHSQAIDCVAERDAALARSARNQSTRGN